MSWPMRNLIWLGFLILGDDYIMDCMCNDGANVDPSSVAGIIDSLVYSLYNGASVEGVQANAFRLKCLD